MGRLRLWVVAILCAVGLPSVGRAQVAGGQAPPQAFTLTQAIQYAVDHYPTVRAAFEQGNASAAGVSVARAAYLPRLDSLWQMNRATANNVFGQLLPQSVIPALSGPVLPAASSGSVWGSAAGALFSWEPLDFGLRQATVVSAEAALTRARAGEALTRLDVQSAVGAAFLGVVGAQRAVTAAQADFDRRDVLARTVQTLVDNQLRPGAEASRAAAERAAAQTRLIQGQQTLILAQTTMARALGVSTGSVAIDAANLLDQVPTADVGPTRTPSAHPLVQARQAAVDLARTEQDVLARTDRVRSVRSVGPSVDPHRRCLFRPAASPARPLVRSSFASETGAPNGSTSMWAWRRGRSSRCSAICDPETKSRPGAPMRSVRVRTCGSKKRSPQPRSPLRRGLRPHIRTFNDDVTRVKHSGHVPLLP